MNFRLHGYFKKGHLSAKLASKPGQPKSVDNNENVNTVGTILQENQ